MMAVAFELKNIILTSFSEYNKGQESISGFTATFFTVTLSNKDFIYLLTIYNLSMRQGLDSSPDSPLSLIVRISLSWRNLAVDFGLLLTTTPIALSASAFNAT